VAVKQTGKFSTVLQMFPRADSVGSRMPAGKLFQTRGPATANDLAHSAVLVRGTSSIEVPADRMPGRRVPVSTPA